MNAKEMFEKLGYTKVNDTRYSNEFGQCIILNEKKEQFEYYNMNSFPAPQLLARLSFDSINALYHFMKEYFINEKNIMATKR